jgi:hypothetical protein
VENRIIFYLPAQFAVSNFAEIIGYQKNTDAE